MVSVEGSGLMRSELKWIAAPLRALGYDATPNANDPDRHVPIRASAGKFKHFCRSLPCINCGLSARMYTRIRESSCVEWIRLWRRC